MANHALLSALYATSSSSSKNQPLEVCIDLFHIHVIIVAAFLTQTVPIEGATVKFEIWDTAGQERYRSLAPMYYRGAAAAIVVYDITNKESFNGAKSWVKELQRRGDPNVVITLAGNKADLQNKRKVEHQVLSPMVSKAMSHNRKLNNMQKKMEFCIWRHRRKMPPMSKVCFKR